MSDGRCPALREPGSLGHGPRRMEPIIHPQRQPGSRRYAAAVGLIAGLIAGAFTVLGVGALLFTAQCHDSEPRAMGATVTWDGRGYAVAWADSSRNRKTSIYAARYSRGNNKFSEPRNVAVVNDLASPPELVANADGYLLVVNRGDNGVATLALTRDFSRRGDSQLTALSSAGPATLCTAPVWSGSVHGLAWGMPVGDDEISYYLALLNDRGVVVRRTHVATVTGSAPACALTERDGYWYMAFAMEDAHGAPPGARRVALAALADGGPSGQILTETITETGAEITLASPTHEGHDELAPPLRLTVDDVGFRLLYRHAEDSSARVVRLNRAGELIAAHRLPDHVAANTMDMVSNQGGWSMAWSRGRYVYLSEFDNQATELRTWKSEKRPAPSSVRMTDHGTECAAVWTENKGAYVWIVHIRGCLATGSGDQAGGGDGLRPGLRPGRAVAPAPH